MNRETEKLLCIAAGTFCIGFGVGIMYIEAKSRNWLKKHNLTNIKRTEPAADAASETQTEE